MSYRTTQSGFTLIELLISIGIFTVMTGIVLTKYNTYNSNAPFANASEDVVLALRQAQVYGVGVKRNQSSCDTLDGSGTSVSSSAFDCRYGVYFDPVTMPNGFKIFADVDDSKTFDTAIDTVVDTIVWKSPIVISSVDCLPSVLGCSSNVLNVTFKRPSPDARIAGSAGDDYKAGQIVISNGLKYSTITISKAGQISLQ